MSKMHTASDKRFLDTTSNKSGDETGYISWKVLTTRYSPNTKSAKNRGGVYGELKFADCSRTINIDMHCRGSVDVEGRIGKVNELLKSLRTLKTALIKSRNQLRTWEKAPFVESNDDVVALNEGEDPDDIYY